MLTRDLEPDLLHRRTVVVGVGAVVSCSVVHRRRLRRVVVSALDRRGRFPEPQRFGAEINPIVGLAHDDFGRFAHAVVVLFVTVVVVDDDDTVTILAGMKVN